MSKKVSTPNLDHLVKTRGDIHDLKELRALKALARAVIRWRDYNGSACLRRFNSPAAQK